MCAEEKKYAAGAGVRDLHNGLQKEGWGGWRGGGCQGGAGGDGGRGGAG